MPGEMRTLFEEVILELRLGDLGGLAEGDREGEMRRTVADTEQVVDIRFADRLRARYLKRIEREGSVCSERR